MAKVNYGATLTDSRGHVGGTVFSRSKAGPTMGRKPSPPHQQSHAQTLARAALAALSKLWASALTPAQRLAWGSLATANPVVDVFGNSHPLSGYQLYIRCNRLRAIAGAAPLTTAPADQVVTALLTATLTATTAPLLQLAFTATPLDADHVLQLFATPPLSPGLTNISRWLKQVAVSAPSQASTYTFTSGYTAIFGPPIAGRTITLAAYTIRISRGRDSTPITSAATS